MKHVKKFESSTNKTYYDELGHDMSMLDYLSNFYDLWCDSEGLEKISADEHDRESLTEQQNDFLDAFLELWGITDQFEYKNSDYDKFMLNRNIKKYNL